jgi:hypothetical protein
MSEARASGGVLRGIREERGQVAGVLLVLLVGIMAIGLMLFQGGKSSLLRAEGVTAADAAAIGGAYNVRDQLYRIMLHTGYPDPNLVNEAEVCARAASEAAEDGGRLLECDHFAFQVRVRVETQEALDGEGAAEGIGEGARGAAGATAELNALYSMAFPTGPPAWGVRANGLGLSVGELKDLAQKAGIDFIGSSSLQHSLPCNLGADTVNLTDEMKIAIISAEAILGHPLQINDGFRTFACQVAAAANPGNPGGRAAAPGRSMHNAGMAIDVQNYGELGRIAHRIGLCQPFPDPGDDPFHFSLSSGVECGGAAGPLGAGGAFGGNPASFVTFEVRLID